MRFDVGQLRYIEKDAWRTLTAVEQGMKNHELVPAPLVDSIAGLRNGGAFKQLRVLLKHKLVHHENARYDGYRLTPLGYDFLALHALTSRGALTAVGRKVGVGKESDVYEVTDESGAALALKLHRLGRTSFRNVRQARDYLRSRTASYNWLHLSHLSALKEHAFMAALGSLGFPVPRAVAVNRHCVLMSLIDAVPLTSVRSLANPGDAWRQAMGLMGRLAAHGLVHCDFNEFNLLIDEATGALTLIDFPQMVSARHLNAPHYFSRDVDCLQRFFVRRYDYRPEGHAAARDLGAVLAQQQQLLVLQQAQSSQSQQAQGGGGGGGEGGGGAGVDGAAQRLDAALRASGYGERERAEWEAAEEARGEGDGGERGENEEGEEGEEREEGEEGEWDEGETESEDWGADGGGGGDEAGEGGAEEAGPLGGGDDDDDDDDDGDGGGGGGDDDDGEGGDGGGVSDAGAEEAAGGGDGAGPAPGRAPAAAAAGATADGPPAAAVPAAAAAAAAPPPPPPPPSSCGGGLSARQAEVRERLRRERRRAGGAAALAAAAGPAAGGRNYAKDKSGSHKKGARASARGDAVWG